MNFERWLGSEPRSRLGHLLATDARVLGGCDLGCTSVGVSWWSTGALPLSRWSFLVAPSSLIHYPRCPLTVVHHFGRLPQPWNESRNKRFPLFRVGFPPKSQTTFSIFFFLNKRWNLFGNKSGKFVWACFVWWSSWTAILLKFRVKLLKSFQHPKNAIFELRQGEHQHWGSHFIEIIFWIFFLF